MLINIFLFELQQRLRRISTYVYFVVFVALGCLFTLLSGGAFCRRQRRIWHRRQDADQLAVRAELASSPTSVSSALSSPQRLRDRRLYQDIDSNSTPFFYTAPITKLDYLGGRFLAAFAVQVSSFSRA